jgi:hypothetical protein
MGNRLISLLFNILFNQTLTDIESCYKMMTSRVAQSLRLTADDFGIAPGWGDGSLKLRFR